MGMGLVGCTEGAVAPAGGSGGPSGDTGTVGEPDTTLALDTWTPPDVAAPADASGDAGPPPDTGTKPGAFGWPCESNDECRDGWCVEAPDGRVCTETCIDACPDGWDCRPVANAGQDVIYVCVSPTARLCWPCKADADCQSPTAAPGARCVDHGDAGSFCGIDCAATGQCPSGYECSLAPVAGGGTALECVPAEAGECQCNGHARTLALQTACANSHEHGTCAGLRACGEEGLAACGALVPAAEICDGVDNDCDGQTDGNDTSDCIQVWPDKDGDGYGQGVSQCLCEVPPGHATQGGDCNEDNASVNPGKPEVCNPIEKIDEDCDGETDEDGAIGCQSWYPDADSDGYGGIALEQCTCDTPIEGYISTGGDCNDADPTINPETEEACNEIDDDCDGETDEEASKGCTVHYLDQDQDGFGLSSKIRCLCGPVGLYTTTDGGDCNDKVSTIHPTALETCNNLDDDCDGTVDAEGIQGCGLFHRDQDQDGYGDPLDVKCLCAPKAPYVVTNGDDCADADPAIHPGATELCDGVDNDCDGQTDGVAGSCENFWTDMDEDGFGVGEPKCLCGPEWPYTADKDGDCDDNDYFTNPAGTETCAPGDENCDGQFQEDGAKGCHVYYEDLDRDDFGTKHQKCLCLPEPPYDALVDGDCYDLNFLVHPLQTSFFYFHRGDWSWDYNCDNVQETKLTALGKCKSWPSCSAQNGWVGGIPPGCGQKGSWVYDCQALQFSCFKASQQMNQECR